ncbi:MAG: FAD-binding protein [Acutalibacteraceae bacterium]
MEETRMTLRGKAFRLILLDTAVVGTGCAGYNAADSLYDLGRTDTAIFTEGIGCGTSRNTGSDKQTYYKLSLASDGMDSIRELAQTLFDGGGVHGDTALAEAAGSVRCFMKLVNLGVPFPTNRFGEYVGYKTDHDPRQRATSAGPLTSRFMTEALERSVRDKGIPIFDGMQAVRLVIFQDKLCGMICLDTRRMEFVSVCCNHLILATGGPAGVYADSVYPHGQIGASGLAVAAGAVCSNLHAWQYGLASLKFRWNVSGTYQQVLPRYISVDQKGGEREFLPDYFETPEQALDNVFLKGYQWPFDAQRCGGSSRIDLIVRHEIKDLGRRVFLDYRRNPTGLARGMQGLGKEAFRYLERSGVLGGTPVERLEKMNPEAVALYRRHGIDLYRERLEIGVCAQHHNGGIAVDSHWESSIPGLFAVGEAAGTFGDYRPGGAALNAAQVGALRAAEHIADVGRRGLPDASASAKAFRQALGALLEQAEGCMCRKDGPDPRAFLAGLQCEMSRHAALLRAPEEIARLRMELEKGCSSYFQWMRIRSVRELPALLRGGDTLLTQCAVLAAMQESCVAGSRGSALVLDPNGTPVPGLPELRFLPKKTERNEAVLLTHWDGKVFRNTYRSVRPIPQTDDWFETVWGDYRRRTADRK